VVLNKDLVVLHQQEVSVENDVEEVVDVAEDAVEEEEAVAIKKETKKNGFQSQN
jgi:hypothetical protein